MSVCVCVLCIVFASLCVWSRDRLSTALDALRAAQQRILRANHRTMFWRLSVCVFYAVSVHFNGHIYAHDVVANRYFRAQQQH